MCEISVSSWFYYKESLVPVGFSLVKGCIIAVIFIVSSYGDVLRF
jgi:hypothetical protein